MADSPSLKSATRLQREPRIKGGVNNRGNSVGGPAGVTIVSPRDSKQRVLYLLKRRSQWMRWFPGKRFMVKLLQVAWYLIGALLALSMRRKGRHRPGSLTFTEQLTIADLAPLIEEAAFILEHQDPSGPSPTGV